MDGTLQQTADEKLRDFKAGNPETEAESKASSRAQSSSMRLAQAAELSQTRHTSSCALGVGANPARRSMPEATSLLDGPCSDQLKPD